jgi:hypothetical protein
MVGPVAPLAPPPPPPGAPRDHVEALNEARRARVSSERAVGAAHRKLQTLHDITDALRGERQDDHFAERMQDSFKSRREE